MNKTIATIKTALECGSASCPCRSNGQTHCPAHDDRKPSLSMNAGDEVQVIVSCHAGCSQNAVIDALKARRVWPDSNTVRSNLRGVSDEPAPVWRVVQEWPYPNDGSPPRAYHGREENGTPGKDGRPNKRNRWRLPEGEYADGLGGLKTSSLPLYNAHLLAERPDDPWVLVEGERAADAAAANGLLAVSLAGGASQTNFGAALEQLRSRPGWLWPDKDESGRKLMRAVALVLPHAPSVTLPGDMPEKGDAAEFFALGHDFASLFVCSNTPSVTVTDGVASVVLSCEGGSVEFLFEYITFRNGAMDAELSVTPRLVGVVEETFTAHLAVTSLSSRDQFRRTLDKQYVLGDVFNWTALLNRACQLARPAYLDAPASIDIEEVTIVPGDDYRVDRFAPMSGVTVVFGMGDSLKGHAMISLSLAINAGAPWLGRGTDATNVLYLDYEDGQQTMARRRNRHILGSPDDWSIPAGSTRP